MKRLLVAGLLVARAFSPGRHASWLWMSGLVLSVLALSAGADVVVPGPPSNDGRDLWIAGSMMVAGAIGIGILATKRRRRER
jgi:hypothetical protein